MTLQSDLVHGYLDGILTEEQQTELAVWIEADPSNADEFAEAVLVDSRLHAEVKAAPYKTQKISSDSARRSVKRRYWAGIVAALAACLLVAFGVSLFDARMNEQQQATGVDPSATTFASVAQVFDADWGESEVLSIGDRLAGQTIHLRSGFVRLQFDDGVEVTLQGPAEYDVIEEGRTRLHSGLLTATVPPGAEGFTVDTPTAEVVDLGTAFGIDLQSDGVSRVSVFEGEVEVALPDTTEKRLLKEGEAVRVEAGQNIESVEFDPEPFAKLWPVSSGIERSTEAFRFVPPWPPQLRFVRSDEYVFIVPEAHAVTLKRSLRMNISEPGEYSREEALTVADLPPGQRIRSFMLFFHPEKAGPRQSPKAVNGSITFDSPVLGLITLQEELQASARRFTRFGPRTVQEGQQLELTGDEDSDVIMLSEDRRKITLELTTPARFAELVRVITDASQPASKDLPD